MRLPVIRTQRLLLRPWTEEDVDALHALWITPEVRRYLWDDKVITREVAAQVVDSYLATARDSNVGFWALYLQSPSSAGEAPMAGFCGFRFIGGGPDIELIYGLQAEHWGKGFAIEACLSAIEYLWRFTSFQVMYARADAPNERSILVMERLGMVRHSTTDSLVTYLLKRPK